MFGSPSQILDSDADVCFESGLLKEFPEFRDEEYVWHYIGCDRIVEDFGKARRSFCKIYCWIGRGVLVFLGDA